MTRILLLLVTVLVPVVAAAEPIDASRISVLDGDTIQIDGAKPDHRLVGFNAPETRRAQSEGERELGDKATARLRAIVRAGKFDYSEVACSCEPGTAGTPRCNFGRKCGVLKANGEDVGAVLIRDAVPAQFLAALARHVASRPARSPPRGSAGCGDARGRRQYRAVAGAAAAKNSRKRFVWLWRDSEAPAVERGVVVQPKVKDLVRLEQVKIFVGRKDWNPEMTA